MPDPTAMGPGVAALLGIVQGLTEFLPVSSSGHLVLAQHWLGLEQRDDITFEISVHVATLFAVVFHYRRDILALMGHWIRGWGCEGGFRHPLWRLTFALLIGTAITGVIGVAGKDALEGLFGQPRLVGVMLIVTAALLASTAFARESESGAAVSLIQAAIIGLVQGLAITPGISRSGSTISVALLLGIMRPEAARFSFLLSIPAILGAVVLKAKDFESISIPLPSLAIGFVSAAIVGYAALRLLVGFVNRGKLWWFAPYCAALGLLAIVFG